MEALLEAYFPLYLRDATNNEELLGMPEESNDKRSSGLSSDLLFKLLPYIILVAGYLVGWGKRDNNLDIVVQQLAEQRTMITSVSDHLSQLSDRVSKIEGSQESLRRDLDQERTYRDQYNRGH